MALSLSFIPILLTISIFFSFVIHPLAAGLVLLLQTILICGITGLFIRSFWFSYILFLIFLGGILILFIYVASLAPNEPFTISITSIFFIVFIIIRALLLIVWDPIIKIINRKTPSSSYYSLYTIPLQTLTTKTFYNPPISNLTLFTILYLLLALIIIVKITDHSRGTLRLAN